jgi:hypothetical protein
MARTLAPRRLTGRAAAGVTFSFATEADDADLRALLRSAPTGGDIALSLEREPSYFAASAIEGPAHHTLIGRDPTTNQLLCAGSISARLRHLNGRPTPIGYLGSLRLAPHRHSHAPLLRQGYAHFRHWHDAAPDRPTLYLTSIAADNHRARRLLEARVPGLPTYRYLDDLVTLLIPIRPRGDFYHPACRARTKLRRLGLTLRRACHTDFPALASFLNRHAARYQFSPHWPPEDLCSPTLTPNLTPSDIRLALDERGQIVGCAALWDQSPLKQAVVRGYSPRLARLRPCLNLVFRLARRPTLPDPGTPIRQAYASFLAADDDRVLLHLLESLHAPAYQRRLAYVTCAFSAKDPRLPLVRRRFRSARAYTTRLYAVHWPDGQSAADSLDPKVPLAPEVATL